MAKSKIRSRYYMIMQYEKNPLTGEDLFFNEAVIIKGIAERQKSLQAWAYIRHDKDKYNQDDDIPEGKEIGDNRPAHWHVMLHFKNAVEIGSLAKTFGVPENYVEAWRGAGSFLDGIQYLTHEHPRQYQELGKHRYEREEVKFPSEEIAQHFWERLDDRTEKLINTLPKAQLIEKLMKKINSGEYDLDDVYQKEKSLFNEQEALFKRARRNYLAKKPIPTVRSNYYITGNGGAGKSVAAKAMARSLFPHLPDEKIFFTVGDGRVAFDRYDGQPVIIWDDWRAKDLLSKFDRGTVWKIFAINPEKISLSVKYGEINLTNTVNIITSVQKFQDFIDELAGEYVDRNRTKHKKEDKTQGYRRFPVFIEVTKQSLEIYVSQALSDGEYKEYERAMKVEASMIEFAQNNTKENLKKILAEDMENKIQIENIIIEEFESAEELLKSDLSKIDIFLMDIMMGEMNGMEAAKKIREMNINSEIIFITGNVEFVIDGYKVNAYRYILKPVEIEELRESIISCFTELGKKKGRFIALSKKGEMEKLKIDDIDYIEVIKRNIIVHKNGEEVEYTGTSIEKLEEKLEDFKFFRCHKSYLVNLEKVDLIKTGEVVVNGKNVPVSKYRAKDLKREFTAILGDMIC